MRKPRLERVKGQQGPKLRGVGTCASVQIQFLGCPSGLPSPATAVLCPPQLHSPAQASTHKYQ